MKKIVAISIYFVLLIPTISVVVSEVYVGEPAAAYTDKLGPYQVETGYYEWNDTARDREVPVKIYFPLKGDGPFPLIIFSHGLGGSREGYEYLGRHWASYGYITVHVQHKGSDVSIWQHSAQARESLRKSVKNAGNAINRTLDISFVIDKMENINNESDALKGRIDLQHIGMAGHSFGAWTTLAVAGEVFTGSNGSEMNLAEPRIKAAIAMSAPSPNHKDQLDKTFAKINIPCMHMTGTLDNSPFGDTMAKERRMPFDHIKGADQYLITFKGGDHMIFASNRAKFGSSKNNAAFHSLICISSTAFWDAYLRKNVAAKKLLTDGGLSTVLDDNAAFEKK